MPPDTPTTDDDDVVGQALAWWLRFVARSIERGPEARMPFEHALGRSDELEHQRVDRDRDNRAREQQGVLRGVDETERQARLAKDERELTDLAQTRGHDEAGPGGIRKEEPARRGDQRFTHHDEGGPHEDLAPVGRQVMGIHEHADRHEEEDGKCLAKRQQISGDLMAEV
jgi:hypothetical protein